MTPEGTTEDGAEGPTQPSQAQDASQDDIGDPAPTPAHANGSSFLMLFDS